jgi:predicted O-methyltransferase YrrM
MMEAKDELRLILMRARAFWESRILMTAAELDVFSLLLDAPKTTAEVCGALSSDPRGTEMLLDALAGMGLLVKENGAFMVKTGFGDLLSSSSPETVLPVVQHMAHLWRSWSNLTDIVRNGKKDERRERDEAAIAAFIGAMHAIGSDTAQGVITKLDLSGRENLIDIGGGSGVYTIAILKVAPEIRGTIFDLPPVIEIARTKIAEEQLTDRVTFVKGDFYKDALPEGHDLALLSAIIHQNSREQNIALYRKACEALVPGGMLIVRDYVMSDDHTQPPDGAHFAINMLVNTPGGGTYSFEEIKGDLAAAGFTDVTLLHQAEMDSLVTAAKPA